MNERRPVKVWFSRQVGIGACLTALVACGTAPTAPAAVDDVVDAQAVASDAAADADAAPVGPARVCKAPSAAAAVKFTDITADFSLGSDAAFFAVANAIAAADVDGDGFADLFTSAVTSHRESTDPNWAGKSLHFLLLNRPDPKIAGKRIFVNGTAESGLLATRDGKGGRGWGLAVLGDLNNDGHVDAILCPTDEVTKGVPGPEDACDAMLGDGKGHFALAPPSDLGKTVFWAPGGVLFDYDRDGNLDFWPSTVAHWPYNPNDPNMPPTLFRGNGDGTFTNVSADVGLPIKDGSIAKGTQWRHTFGNVACDIDGDGDDDMITASYGRQECQLWLNTDGKFDQVADQLGIDHDAREDFSDDQSYRCFCQANPTDAKHCTPMPPAPVVQKCDQAFGPNSGPYFRGWQPGVTDQPWSLGGNYFSFACGDIDDDGDFDLLSATIVHGDVGSAADPSELIINPGNGGKFLRPGNKKMGIIKPEDEADWPAANIYWNHGESMAVMVDVDLDGRKDIMWTQTGAYGPTDTASLWRQKKDGSFERIDDSSGLITAEIFNFGIPSWIDVDGDGDLDLVTSTNYKADGDDVARPWLIVFRNEKSQTQNLVRVHLDGGVGKGANRSAIGAVVQVTAGGRTQTLRLDGGYGHGNVQNDLTLTFGLGASCDIDVISVRWPDSKSTVTKYANVSANHDVTLTLGNSAVVYGDKAY